MSSFLTGVQLSFSSMFSHALNDLTEQILYKIVISEIVSSGTITIVAE